MFTRVSASPPFKLRVVPVVQYSGSHLIIIRAMEPLFKRWFRKKAKVVPQESSKTKAFKPLAPLAPVEPPKKHA